MVFDYHYLSDPVLSDIRDNASRGVFRVGKDYKNSIFCTVDGRPNMINMEYKNGKIFNQNGIDKTRYRLS